ncbi:uncharacterized protein LOC128985929 [Macrosteles quadrilineatus]|uniref:uncharacterized protein LOC128985929 n=1 Tax=Macrosteles quadrilineatus TaxID=74068 RepID=UPI0023E1626A|nr:uncharacterized protein LOC128985929 [Macrosteles quadrilineatus]
MGEQGHKDIQYNYIVGGDGFIYEGLGWTKASRMLLEFPLVLKGSTVVVGLMGTKWKDSSKLMQSSLSSLFTVATIEGLLKENMELFDFSNGILSKPSDKPENVVSSFPPT